MRVRGYEAGPYIRDKQLPHVKMAPDRRQPLRRRPSPRAAVAPARRPSPVAASLTGLPGGVAVDAACESVVPAPWPQEDPSVLARRRRLSATAHRRRTRCAAAVNGAGSVGPGSAAGAPPERRGSSSVAPHCRPDEQRSFRLLGTTTPLLPRPVVSPLVSRARSATPSRGRPLGGGGHNRGAAD